MKVILHILKSPWFWVVLISLLPLFPLIHDGIPFTHDGRIHVARIASFYQSLAEGNIIPRWSGNLNWGYGSPIIMFVYPLTSYIASLFHGIGFSLVDSTKLVFALAFILSAVTMFLWAKTQWGKMAGIVAAIFYCFAPYRFVDLYVRGAIGEHIAFIFPPLIFWTLLQLTRNAKKPLGWTLLVGISTAGLILSHNALSVMFLPVVGIYAVYLYFFETKQPMRFAFYAFSGLFYGFLLSAFFWVPAVFEQKYTLIDIVTKGNIDGRFTSLSWFLYSPWNYKGGDQFTKELGIVQWIGVLASFWYLWKTKTRSHAWFIGGGLFILITSLFLMTSQSAIIWDKVALMEKFQFPWRFLSLTSLITAALGGVVASVIPKKYTVGVVVVLSIALLISMPQWRPHDYLHVSDSDFTGIFDGTTDTGEGSPIWSVRFMEHRAKASLVVISGASTWAQESRTTTKHVYNLTATTPTRIVESTLYFPGWKIFVDGQETPLEFQDPDYRGLMTFWVPAGKHHIIVEFGDTKVRTLSNSISAVAWVGLLGITAIGRGKRLKQT